MIMDGEQAKICFHYAPYCYCKQYFYYWKLLFMNNYYGPSPILNVLYAFSHLRLK